MPSSQPPGGPSPQGLTSAQVRQRVQAGQVNTPPDSPTKSVRRIVLENLFDEFCRVLDELFHNFISCLAQQILFNGLILSHNAPKYKNSRSE